MDQYKIGIGLNFGPVVSVATARDLQKELKKQSPGIKFTAVKKARGGYKFSGTITEVKFINASISVVKQTYARQLPEAKITVVNLTHKRAKAKADATW